MTPDERLDHFLELQDSFFDLYMEAQTSQGLTREQALQRLRTIWEEEDRQRQAARARSAQVLARGR
jgi:hypothetical protein